jgi:hypothetical protein
MCYETQNKFVDVNETIAEIKFISNEVKEHVSCLTSEMQEMRIFSDNERPHLSSYSYVTTLYIPLLIN